jgi:hypothetical protein
MYDSVHTAELVVYKLACRESRVRAGDRLKLYFLARRGHES